MKIKSITLQGFRCFGPAPTTIRLSEEITTFVGANGSGKTALLEALLRVFGTTRKQRDVSPKDFYVDPETSSEDSIEAKTLTIDVRLSIPELESDIRSTTSSVPSVFKHFQVSAPGEKPFVRIRLEATWCDDRTLDGDIVQKLHWVMSNDEIPAEQDMRPCESHQRGLIQVHYVPASRDPSTQLKYAATAMAGRLLRVVDWSADTQKAVEDSSERIRKAFGEEFVVKLFNSTLTSEWNNLHDDSFYTEPEFNIASKRIEEEIRRVGVIFQPTEHGGEADVESLSDGQKSLFYFSLVAAIFDVERKLVQNFHGETSLEEESYNKPSSDLTEYEEIYETTTAERTSTKTGFYSERLQTPELTIFAFEEPENHLSPYYLSRIIKQIRSLVCSHSAQAVLTSHSSAVLGRIEPTEVRHFRLDYSSRCSSVKEINLPVIPEDASKYVQEAILAYPELYFARFVILGEGDSEQIVIPRLASAIGFDIDRSFVAIVPLGGRHVNHLWKLLHDLEIPHATLLDLDQGRKGAGWGRIKYVCNQLLQVGTPPDELLSFTNECGDILVISEEELKELHNRDNADGTINEWIDHLEKFNVFFSSPLDLDMSMLSKFPIPYKNTTGSSLGPNIPSEDSSRYEDYMDSASSVVLGEGSDPQTYSDEMKGLFPWYRYLFLNRSKPSTHLQAISKIDDGKLASDAPQELRRLLTTVNKILYPNT
ncbi:MAG: AAA family ATPase [Cyanobacteria bacterium P01_D01_bin.105]